MKSLVHTVQRYIKRAYDKTHLFTDQEAWGVYRFAAFVEAGVWVFFIASFTYFLAGLSLSEEVMRFGRSIIGVAVVVYALLTLLVARSMEWKVGRIGLALLAGVVPLGSLVFEHLVGKHRTRNPVFIAPPEGYDE